jgi:mannosyltransferase OCH1-like enzyme
MNSDTLPGGITKVIHRVWLGPEQPAEFVAFGEAWTMLHPTWQVLTWRDWNIPALENRSAFDDAANAAQAVDVLRHELLLRFGGVYVDTDMEPLRPLDELLADERCVFCREDDRWVATGFVAAAPGHPFLDHVCALMSTRLDGRRAAPPNESLGPRWITELLASGAPGSEDVTVLPPERFYPYHFSELHRRGERFPDAYAVHHWAHSWGQTSA